MSYTNIDQSVELGQPVELYMFAQASESWYLTNSPFSVSHNLIEYKPTNISRTEVTVSGEMDKANVTITVARDDEFGYQFVEGSQDFVTTVTILRGHLSDTVDDFAVQWKGRIVSAKAGNHDIQLTSESVFTSMRRHGVHARFQKTCRHVLYSAACGALQGSFMTQGEVIGVDATKTELSLSNVNAYPDGYFSGGILKDDTGVLRFITNHVGNNISLDRPMSSAAGGVIFQVFPGCDHLKETCRDKFGNLVNFGGFPYIPTKNPFGGTSLV